MRTVYTLHKVSLSKEFLIKKKKSFSNCYHKQGEEPCGGTEKIRLLDLVLPC